MAISFFCDKIYDSVAEFFYPENERQPEALKATKNTPKPAFAAGSLQISENRF